MVAIRTSNKFDTYVTYVYFCFVSLIVTYMTGFQLFVKKKMGATCGAGNAHSFRIT